MFSFTELMSLKTDILTTHPVKYIRHSDTREAYRDVVKDREQLLKYQAEQDKAVFKNCDYLASFVGLEQSKALFIGLFKVDGCRRKGSGYEYQLSEVEGFEDCKDRVIIDWGKGTQSWHQWVDKNPKTVLEILPQGYIGEFPGLLNFTLDMSELIQLQANPSANKDWYLPLSTIKGIYLILDTHTGNQYIGSACGERGIWQRWADYARNGHGGNQQLKVLCQTTKNYEKYFQFTLLQSVPSNTTEKEVIALESLYKQKLGTRVFGLNSN